MTVRYFDGPKNADGSNVDEVMKNESRFDADTAYRRFARKDNVSVAHFGSKSEKSMPWRQAKPPK